MITVLSKKKKIVKRILVEVMICKWQHHLFNWWISQAWVKLKVYHFNLILMKISSFFWKIKPVQGFTSIINAQIILARRCILLNKVLESIASHHSLCRKVYERRICYIYSGILLNFLCSVFAKWEADPTEMKRVSCPYILVVPGLDPKLQTSSTSVVQKL